MLQKNLTFSKLFNTLNFLFTKSKKDGIIRLYFVKEGTSYGKKYSKRT